MKRFTLKDIVFLAVLSAVLLLVSSLIMPIVMFTQLFALRQLLAAPVFALFCAIGIRKVSKIGTLTIIGFFSGFVLLFMSPIMFFNNFFGAIIAEVLTLIIFKNYTKRSSIIFSAGIYIPITLPITLFFTAVMRGKSFSAQIGNGISSAAVAVGSIALGIAGAWLGMKIADELEKAGKLK